MVVGQLSAKPKYPKGHVGRRSRERSRSGSRLDPKEVVRRQHLRAARRTLSELDGEARKASLKQLRAAFRQGGMSSRGLGRRSAPATPVARVAGVIASDKRTGQYHRRAMEQRRRVFRFELESVRAALFGRGDLTARMKQIGINSVRAIRQAFVSTGHVDTGRLLRHIDHEFYSVSGKARVKAAAKEQRALARASRRRNG